jgi:hypothetical protein
MTEVKAPSPDIIKPDASPAIPGWIRLVGHPWVQIPLVSLIAVLFLFAFVNQEIYVDEAWLGQQVYTLWANGSVSSPFFQDLPPLDGAIVVYHKLLIWTAAGVSSVIGWGLYELRVVPLLCGLALLGLVYWRLRRSSGVLATGAILVLLATPLFYRYMILFRPEMMVALFGFASFLSLERASGGKGAVWIFASGLFAGLAGSTHAAGLAFAAAGAIGLLAQRRMGGALLFCASVVIGFLPYVSGYFTDRALFLDQVLHNPLFGTDLSNSWLRAPLNVLEEHKRWFRKPEVIGLSVLFLLAMFQMRREEFSKHRFFWWYVGTLAFVLAAAPIPKITRYMVSLAPFMAIVISERLCIGQLALSPLHRVLRPVFAGWFIVFVVFGLWSLFDDGVLHRNDQAATNSLLASQMEARATVIAPFDFIFEEQPNFNIVSFRGVRLAAGQHRTALFLESYADVHHAQYLLFSPEEMDDWGLDRDAVAASFTLYEPVACAPQNGRWLLRRLPVR